MRRIVASRAALCAGAGVLMFSAAATERSTPVLCAASTADTLTKLESRVAELEKLIAAPSAAPSGPITVEPLAAPLKGAVWEVPGSKSITNRALILAALRTGTTNLSGQSLCVRIGAASL